MDLSSESHDVDSTLNNNQEGFATEMENDTLHSRDETLHGSSSSSSVGSSAPNKGKGKATKLPKQADEDQHFSGDNLVGKINNLVTTDLANIVEARDFLVVLVYIPLQITLSITFLYVVLGWRWVITSHQCYLIIDTFQCVRGTGCHHLVISNHWIRHQAHPRRPSYQAEEDRCSSSDSHGKRVLTFL
jgi:hypothetical protein